MRVFLEKVAPLFGLLKSDAPWLQVEFSESILPHKLELAGAGLCDGSLCSVLGVETALVIIWTLSKLLSWWAFHQHRAGSPMFSSRSSMLLKK